VSDLTGARPAGRCAAVVLAAGAATRFGGAKVLAALEGRPLLAHVLAALRTAGIDRIVLVLGREMPAVRAGLLTDDPGSLAGVVVAVNPAPERGLASSLRLGIAAATAVPQPAGVLVLLGDQPRVQPAVIAALVAAAGRAPEHHLAVIPVYRGDDAPNPVLALPPAWTAVAGLAGDRGLGSLLEASPDRVIRVPVDGANPDVDTPADLSALDLPHRSNR
jgi:molybdenum cofactor cytidylyltransferase